MLRSNPKMQLCNLFDQNSVDSILEYRHFVMLRLLSKHSGQGMPGYRKLNRSDLAKFLKNKLWFLYHAQHRYLSMSNPLVWRLHQLN